MHGLMQVIFLGLIVGAGAGYLVKVLAPVMVEAKAKRDPVKAIRKG